MIIRKITPEDNAAIEHVIRTCLIEFGGNRAGLAWEDDSLKDLAHYYDTSRRAYWVIEQDGQVLGGTGIAEYANSEEICELQKMYLMPEARGTGIAAKLLDEALSFAAEHYQQCYLETLQNMTAANRFYVKHGFESLAAPLAGSDHFACDAWYLKNL